MSLEYNIEQYSNSYLLNSVDSSHQVVSRYRASDDLKRNPIIANEESGGYTHHRVFIQGGLRNFFLFFNGSKTAFNMALSKVFGT